MINNDKKLRNVSGQPKKNPQTMINITCHQLLTLSQAICAVIRWTFLGGVLKGPNYKIFRYHNEVSNFEIYIEMIIYIKNKS